MLYVILYRGSVTTLSTNLQDATFPVTVSVGSIEKQWQADLADMVRLQRENNGNRYILTVVDVFSKYSWSVPVKYKNLKSIRDAFKLVLTSTNPRKPERLQTDIEREFLTVSLRVK